MDFVIFEAVFSRFSRLKPENEDFKGNLARWRLVISHTELYRNKPKSYDEVL